MDTVRIGDHEIFELSDGMSRLPPSFYPGLDVEMHPEVLDRDGTVHIPTGCFLVRGPGATILVLRWARPDDDPVPGRNADVARRFAARRAGRGWLRTRGRRSRVPHPPASRPRRLGRAGDSSADKGMHVVRTAGRTRQLTESAVRLTEGVTARHAPGHTPGSYILVVTSGEDSAYLLCDVVHSPLQLTNSGIAFATDADVALATRTRSALFREMEQATAIGMNHISGFHRKLAARAVICSGTDGERADLVAGKGEMVV
jgi:hypothetical protein